MSGIEAKIIADSVNPAGKRLTTFQLRFHRYVLAEFNTHRMLSRSARSSRAVPTRRIIDEVIDDPAIPVEWGSNQRGMVAGQALDAATADECLRVWLHARDVAARTARSLDAKGLHKQWATRLVEPFMWAHVVVTATDWANFLHLRTAPDAQPEMREVAIQIGRLLRDHEPHRVEWDGWHLPYVTDEERAETDTGGALVRSVARCARVSYNPPDGSSPSPEKDRELVNRLESSGHRSPFEHQAQACIWVGRSGNFDGQWRQFRKTFDGENITTFDPASLPNP